MDSNNPTQENKQQSYYVKVCLNYLKVQYQFAKKIKPGVSYRFKLEKNGKIIDEMKDYLKARMIGGKIQFQPNVIFGIDAEDFDVGVDFDVQIKMYEKQEAEEEKYIAHHVIYPVTYLNKYKHFQRKYYRQEAQLLTHLYLNYSILVHHSKIQLQKIIVSFHNVSHHGKETRNAFSKQQINNNKQINLQLPQPKQSAQPLSRPSSRTSRLKTPLIQRKQGKQKRFSSSHKDESIQSVSNNRNTQQKKQKSPNFVSVNRKISTNSEVVGFHQSLKAHNNFNHKFKLKKFESMKSQKNDESEQQCDVEFKKLIHKYSFKENLKNNLKLQMPEVKEKAQNNQSQLIIIDNLQIKKEDSIPKVQKQRQFNYLKNQESPKLFNMFQSSQGSNKNSRQSDNNFPKIDSPCQIYKNNKSSIQDLSSIKDVNKFYSFESYKPQTEAGYPPYKYQTQNVQQVLSYSQTSEISQSNIRQTYIIIRNKIFYTGFMILSFFLLWNALLPSKRV